MGFFARAQRAAIPRRKCIGMQASKFGRVAGWPFQQAIGAATSSDTFAARRVVVQFARVVAGSDVA
eukprot:2566387-Lingulodinium_polyedra.AAC.1